MDDEKLLVDKSRVAYLHRRAEDIKLIRPNDDQFLLGEAAGIKLALNALGLRKEEEKP